MARPWNFAVVGIILGTLASIRSAPSLPGRPTPPGRDAMLAIALDAVRNALKLCRGCRCYITLKLVFLWVHARAPFTGGKLSKRNGTNALLRHEPLRDGSLRGFSCPATGPVSRAQVTALKSLVRRLSS